MFPKILNIMLKRNLIGYMVKEIFESETKKKSKLIFQTYLDNEDFHKKSTSGNFILLINPYIYDIRYPWIKWNQPLGLLKIGTLLREYGHQVKLLDCLQPNYQGRVRRRKIGEIKRGQYSLNLWNYGLQKNQLINFLKQFKKDPNEIWITCMVSYWWVSAFEITQLCKQLFPKARIVVGGAYPSLFTDHVKEHFNIPNISHGDQITNELHNGFEEDIIIKGGIPQVFDKYPDFTLYNNLPTFAAINAVNKEKLTYRNPYRVVSEIEYVLHDYKIQNFVFFDDNLLVDEGKHIERILDIIMKKDIKVKFWGLHGIDPSEITESIILKMKKGGFHMITLECSQKNTRSDINIYKKAINSIIKAGYKKRSASISCQYYIGRPKEDLGKVMEDILDLHHVVGTVIPVPFVPTPNTCEYKEYYKIIGDDIPLEKLNVNLFPFAEYNGYTISDYFDLIRMTTMLNKKVRRQTFDFLGDNDVAQALQRSVSYYQKSIKTTEMI